MAAAVHTAKSVPPTKTKHAADVNGGIKKANETSRKQNAKLKSAVSIMAIIHVPIAVVLHRVTPFKNFTKRNHTNTRNTKKQLSLSNRTVMQSS